MGPRSNGALVRDKPMSSPVKDTALQTLKSVGDTLSATMRVVDATDDVNLAVKVITAAINDIDLAIGATADLAARTATLKSASHAIQQAQDQINRDFHRICDDDTVDGRAQTMYSLKTRLQNARVHLTDFLATIQ